MAFEVGGGPSDDQGLGHSYRRNKKQFDDFAFSPGEKPHDNDAELALLSGILISNETISDIQDKVKAEDFYLPAHQEIYRCMMDLAFGNIPVDFTTLTNGLRDKGKLDSIGGPAAISRIAQVPSTSAHAVEYADIVANLSWRRRLLAACDKGRMLAIKSGATQEIATLIEKEIFDAAQERSKSNLAGLGDLLEDVILEFERRTENKDPRKDGVFFGLTDLDDCLCGLRPGQLVVLAAGPGTGKSSLAVNMLVDATTKQEKTVLFFTLEMTKEDITERIISGVANIDSSKIRRGNLSPDDFNSIYHAAEDLASAQFYIDDRSVVTPYDVLAQARRLQSMLKMTGKGKIDLIVCDYIQIMKAGGRQENRSLEVAAITGGLKAIAKDLQVPVLALSQLNRERSKRQGTDSKLPTLSDLRDSGAIEQDADVVLFIHREQGPENDSREPAEAKIIVAKNRAGPTKHIRVTWLGNLTKYVDFIDPSYAPIDAYQQDSTGNSDKNFGPIISTSDFSHQMDGDF